MATPLIRRRRGWGRLSRVRGRMLLAGSMLVAVAITVLTTVVLVIVEPTVSRAEALKTGGLAGGSVVALYALWLNDRRRRTEEARHELESDKVADERFARAVELLGNPADQVRVGALHALVELAGATPRYRQTVLDVLCAYLRMPFTGEDDAVSNRERQVRLAAQRLITDLLPWGQNLDPRRYHLDLTGALLEDFRLEGRRIGRLVARHARLYGVTALGELDASKPVLFTGAAFHGRVDMRDARLTGGISLRHSTFAGEVAVAGATAGTFVDVRTAPPGLLIGGLTVGEGTRVDGDLTPWTGSAAS